MDQSGLGYRWVQACLTGAGSSRKLRDRSQQGSWGASGGRDPKVSVTLCGTLPGRAALMLRCFEKERALPRAQERWVGTNFTGADFNKFNLCPYRLEREERSGGHCSRSLWSEAQAREWPGAMVVTTAEGQRLGQHTGSRGFPSLPVGRRPSGLRRNAVAAQANWGRRILEHAAIFASK